MRIYQRHQYMGSDVIIGNDDVLTVTYIGEGSSLDDTAVIQGPRV